VGRAAGRRKGYALRRPIVPLVDVEAILGCRGSAIGVLMQRFVGNVRESGSTDPGNDNATINDPPYVRGVVGVEGPLGNLAGRRQRPLTVVCRLAGPCGRPPITRSGVPFAGGSCPDSTRWPSASAGRTSPGWLLGDCSVSRRSFAGSCAVVGLAGTRKRPFGLTFRKKRRGEGQRPPGN
jgi:hypothetical protein